MLDRAGHVDRRRRFHGKNPIAERGEVFDTLASDLVIGGGHGTKATTGPDKTQRGAVAWANSFAQLPAAKFLHRADMPQASENLRRGVRLSRRQFYPGDLAKVVTNIGN